MIFDICNVFPFFKMNPDGKTDNSDQALSLNQKIFMQKVTLFKTMQSNYSKLDIDDKKFYDSLRFELIDEIKSLNRNYIGVHSNLEYVEKYSNPVSWMNFSQQNLTEIKKHIAPNVQGSIDLEAAKAFDYLCYKFASTKFNQNADFKKVAKTVYALGKYLIDFKGHIAEVAEHINTLDYVTSNDFINKSTVVTVEKIRKELRELMRYIDPNSFKPIISDFDDEINSFEDAVEDEVDFHVTVDDFKTLDEKALFLIQTSPNIKLVYQVQNLIKPTEEAIKEFKSEIIKLAKTADEYNQLFKEDSDLVVFVRKNLEMNPIAIEDFIQCEKSKDFDEMQIKYLKELLIFISQNGKFERKDLLREELTFNGIFNNIQINKLISDIEERI